MRSAITACLATLAVLTLAACGEPPSSTPPPIVAVKVTDQALTAAYAAADELRSTVTSLRKAGDPCCVPGSERAAWMANILDSTAQYLEAASAAHRLGNNLLSGQNLASAWSLLRELRKAATGPDDPGEIR